MIKAHVIKLYPTKSQQIFFKKSCGVRRFTYNWALSQWNELYAKGEKTSAYSLIKHLNSIKKQQFPWMQETGKCCQQYAIHDVENGWKKFFRDIKQKRKDAEKPKFKKKGTKDSFVAVENYQCFKQQNFKLWIPRLGYVKCAENLRFEGKVNNVTVKRIADMWFAVINIDISKKTSVINENQVIMGVDLGIKSMAVTSDGSVYENPKALKKNMRSLKRKQRSLSRKVKGSKNRAKQQIRVARAHYKVSCIRKNSIHQATTDIVRKADIIVLEDLNVSGMLKNHNLAQAIGDVSLYEFRRQIEYKALWSEKQVIIADKWFASSKTCSGCGHKKPVLKLSEREFHCENCDLKIDRDLNAAINLANYGSTLKHSGSNACRDESSLVSEKKLVSSSWKQEKRLISNNLIS